MYAGFRGPNASFAKIVRVASSESAVPVARANPTQTAKKATTTKTYALTRLSSFSVLGAGRVLVLFGSVTKSWIVPIGQTQAQGARPMTTSMINIAPIVKNGKIPVENSRIKVSNDPAIAPKGASRGARIGIEGRLFHMDIQNAWTLGILNHASSMYPLTPMKNII
jgi:hypothetical protein